MSAVSRWDLPTVAGKTVQGRRAGKTVSELEEVDQRTHKEAYAKGHAAGVAAARAESQQALDQLKNQVASIDKMVAAIAQPFADLDAQVEEQLVQLSVTIARQLVRRELRMDPAQVIAIVRETVALLPAATRDVRVHLHPDDAAVVREKLAMPSADRAWTIVEDPVMTRGGCRVTTDTAHIDQRLETRIQGIMAAILGEERSDAGRGA
ncbi:MAG TPA: FliH/SctL family protein [Steroidobacteraceae bacterium]|nr:FliH/SctL family protein [Steroidobacteraceae bacterium]